MKSKHLLMFFLLCVFTTSCIESKENPVAPNNHGGIEINNLVEATIKDSTTSYFLSLSDVHLDSNRGYTKFGRHNDTGDSLWARTKTEIEKVIKTEKPKFMVYLGDLPHHSDATRVKNVTLMLEHLRSLNMNIPLLYLPGNNDSLGGDYNSFLDDELKNPFSVDENSLDPWPILHETSGTAKISNMDFKSNYGYYSTDLTVGGETLKIIALNTVIFTNSYYKSDDKVSQKQAAQLQFNWLEQTLNALDNKTPILIMMHIPPGIDNYSQSGLMWNSWDKVIIKSGRSLSFQNAFLEIISKKKKQIKGILTSHTHFDGLRRLYNSDKTDKNELIAVSISTPGITIGHGNNPGFKLFEYSNSTYDILDFKTYYGKPTAYDSIFKFSGDSYTFKSTYKINDPNQSIFESIAAMDSVDIKTYMSKILAVESYKTNKINSGYDYYNVMNVLKDQ